MMKTKEEKKTMKKIISIAASFLMAVTVLTGCGGGGDDKAAKKDEVRVAIGGDAAYLDPAIVDDSITANILNQMYDGLYQLDKEGNTVPVLAEGDPEVSEDGLTYTVKLKKGIKWSDGEELTANDFVYAWKRATAIGVGKAYYSAFISNYIAGAVDGQPIEEAKDFGAKALDDYTIEIKLKARTPYFDALLTQTVYYPVRQDFIEDGGFDPLESAWSDEANYPTDGAFVATEINSKSKIVLEKNKEYWDADAVKLNTISFTVMTDMDAETNGFQTGELDFATLVNPQTVLGDEELKKDAYIIDPYIINYYVLINAGQDNTVEALKNPEIRKAMSEAIDRKDIVDAYGYGEWSYELYGLIPKGIPGATGDFREEADAEQPYVKTDLEDAKALMEKNGYNADNRLELTYKYNELAGHKDVAQALQAAFKNIYIDLTLVGSEKEVFFTERDQSDFELARHAMSADYIDPMAYLSMYYGFDLAANTVDDATYEKMVDEANAEADPTVRMEKLHAAEKYLVMDNNYIIPLIGYSEPILKDPALEGVESSPEGHYDLTRAYYK